MWLLKSFLLVVLLCGANVRSDEVVSEEDSIFNTFPWGYADSKPSERPERWGDNFPECSGEKQSPIDVVSDEATFSGYLNENLLKFHGYDDDTVSKADSFLYNDGHGISVIVEDGTSKAMGIYGGGLFHHYSLIQFHWHWGTTNSVGSEHTIDGKSYAAEVHFVHGNTWYNDEAEKILTSSDGLAVVGVLIEVGARNPVFDPILEYFEDASKEGANSSSTRLNLPSLMGFFPEDRTKYYRYQGSLTTPPCSEAVIWTVMKDTITISEDQLAKFRTLVLKKKGASSNQTPTSASNLINNNYRPVQPLNGRIVYSSFSSKPGDQQNAGSYKWSYDGSHDKCGAGSPYGSLFNESLGGFSERWEMCEPEKNRYARSSQGSAPENWSGYYKQCSGPKQSPIHIMHEEAVPSPLIASQPWVLTNYEKAPENFQAYLENNGHTMGVIVNGGVSVSGGGLPATYTLVQFHFHWGSHSLQGSEHVMNGKKYAAELHLVHVNGFYKTDGQIQNNQDGLAVLGILIDVGEHNKAFDPIVEQLTKPDVQYPSESSDTKVKLTSLRQFLPDDISEFYRYQGSLTTPPCFEAVLWTVFKNPITMSEAQLNSFRKLYSTAATNSTVTADSGDGSHIEASTHAPNGQKTTRTTYVVDNFRPLQKLNDRVVKYGKIRAVRDNTTSGAGYIAGSSLAAIFALLLSKLYL